MGTRSNIIGKLSDGTWKRIYCHWDGYLEHNGDILFRHYSQQDKVDALLAPGDMSSLEPDCSRPSGHSYGSPVKGHCVYYGRDRGEEGTEGHTGADLASVWPPKDSWTQYTYVWDGSKWLVGNPFEAPEHLVNLGSALQTEAAQS